MRAALPPLRWLVAGLVLVVAIAVIAVGQLWLHTQRAHDDRDADIRDAAETTVTALLSYDYRRLEDGMNATLPLLTGDAKAQYVEQEKLVLKVAPKIHTVIQASVKTMALLESDDDSARVLLFVDQQATNTKMQQPELDQSRMLVTMEKQDGKWLVSTARAF